MVPFNKNERSFFMMDLMGYLCQHEGGRTAVPKVSEQYSANRRREILVAALRCFARKGFHATSMSDIIAESGLSAGAIYGHYSSKGELITSVAAEVFDPARPEVSGRRTDSGRVVHPIDFSAQLLESIVVDLGHASILVQVWGQAAVDESVREVFVSVFDRLLDTFRRQITDWLHEERGMPSVEAEARAIALAAVLGGLNQGGVIQSSFYPDFDLSAYLNTARALFD